MILSSPHNSHVAISERGFGADLKGVKVAALLGVTVGAAGVQTEGEEGDDDMKTLWS